MSLNWFTDLCMYNTQWFEAYQWSLRIKSIGQIDVAFEISSFVWIKLILQTELMIQLAVDFICIYLFINLDVGPILGLCSLISKKHFKTHWSTNVALIDNFLKQLQLSLGLHIQKNKSFGDWNNIFLHNFAWCFDRSLRMISHLAPIS